MIIDNDMMAKIIAKAQDMITNYDGQGIDEWDAVMVNDKDGFDINVYQEDEDEEFSVVIYAVKDQTADYEDYKVITKDVLIHKPKCPKCACILQQGKIVSEGYHHYCLKCDDDFNDTEVIHHDNT